MDNDRNTDAEHLVRGLRAGTVSRRQFMAAMSAAGLAVVAMPISRAARAAADNIEYFTWSSYEVPDLHQSFLKKYGKSPDATFFGTATEGLQKIRAGYKPDLAHPCIFDMQQWHDAGVLAPIDTARLTHWNDLFPQLRALDGVRFDGQVFFAPCDWGSSSIIYRSDVYEGEETWGMLSDERYKGRIAARDSYAMVQAAAAILGIDINSPTDAELAGPISDLLRKQRGLVRFYWDDQTTLEQAFASGEVDIAFGWNASVINLRKQGIPVAYANPKEGAWTWLCGLVRITGGTGDEQMGYDFIDAWQAPETGKWLIENYNYGHSNPKAFPEVDPKLLDDLGMSDPAAVVEQAVFPPPNDPEMEAKMTKLFEEIKAGN